MPILSNFELLTPPQSLLVTVNVLKPMDFGESAVLSARASYKKYGGGRGGVLGDEVVMELIWGKLYKRNPIVEGGGRGSPGGGPKR